MTAVYVVTETVALTDDSDSLHGHYPLSAISVFSNEDAAKRFAEERIKDSAYDEDEAVPELTPVGNNEGWWECTIESFCDVTYIEVRRLLVNDNVRATAVR